MVLFLSIAMLMTLVMGTMCSNQNVGACFLRKSPRGCKGFMAFVTRKQCCEYRGFFVRKPDPGQLFLAVMISSQNLPNCEDPCGQDHCENKQCGKGQKCIVRQHDGICTSDCQCTRQQQLSGPVCVLNGPKYKNLCELHLESCWRNTNETVIPCKQTGCDKKQCADKQCVLTLKGRSECIERITDCENVPHAPLCGVDNVTYLSACHIKKAGIERKREIHVAYKGTCNANARCSNVDCPETDMSCINHHKDSSPVCIKCPQSMLDCNNEEYQSNELFCLSISRQSQNTCYSDYLSCQNNVFIEIIHSGLCLQIARLPRLDK